MAAHHKDKKLTKSEKLNFTGWFYTNITLTHKKNMNKLYKRLLLLKYELSDIKWCTQKAG
jgi:hypothetical protein